MKKKQEIKKPKRIYDYFFVGLLVVIFGLYFRNLTRDIYGGDVGDLVTAAYVMGVAHPPGYPLMTLMGNLLSHVPLPYLFVTKFAFVSLFSSIGSLIVFRKIISEFVKDRLIQYISVAVLAFSYLFWLYSEIPEVFALNNLLCLAVVYLSIKLYSTRRTTYLYLLAIIFGLGVSNHQTIFLVAPLPFFILIYRWKKLVGSKKKLVILPVFFLLGAISYLYVPIAASREPILNWDDAKNLSNFLGLITRKDYGTFSAGHFQAAVLEEKLLILKQYGLSVIASVTLPAFLISIYGMLKLLRSYRFLAIALTLTIMICGPIFVLYASFPIYDTFILGTAERFYLLSEVLLMIFFPIGLLGIRSFFEKVFSKKLYATVLIGVFILIPLLLIKANLPKTDLSKTRLGTEFGRDYFRNLPPHSFLIVEGDTKTFNTWYVRYVLNYRTDIDMVPLGNYAAKNKYFSAVMDKVGKGKHDMELDLWVATIKEIAKSRPVFSTTPITLNDKNYEWIPRGLSVELILSKNFPDENTYKKMIINDFKGMKIPERADLTLPERNLSLSDIPSYYADSYVRIGDFYFNKYADFTASYYYYEYAIVVDPQYSKGYVGKSRVQNQRGQCANADSNIVQAISLLPTEKSYYLFWYLTALECDKDPKKTIMIAQLFTKQFHLNIVDEINKSVKKL